MSRWPMFGVDLGKLADLIEAIEQGTDQPPLPFEVLLR